MTSYHYDLRNPMYGRLFFAGEHTDVPHGWMDTSLRSGVRAAREVHEEVRGARTRCRRD